MPAIIGAQVTRLIFFPLFNVIKSFFSVLSVPWVHRPREDPIGGRDGTLRVPTLRQVIYNLTANKCVKLFLERQKNIFKYLGKSKMAARSCSSVSGATAWWRVRQVLPA